MEKIGKELKYLTLTYEEAVRVVEETKKHKEDFFWPKIGANPEFLPLRFFHRPLLAFEEGESASGVLLCEARTRGTHGGEKTLVWRLIDLEACHECGSMRQDQYPLEWVASGKKPLDMIIGMKEVQV